MAYAAQDQGHRPRRLRFPSGELLPVAVLTIVVLAIVSTGAPTHRPSVIRLARQIDAASLAELVILGILVAALTDLVAPFQRTAVRALEGYWGGSWLAATLARLVIRVQRSRLERLRRHCYEPAETARQERLQRVAAERLESYPAIDDLLPTRLGNVLRAAERQAGERYGFDTVTVWPHLYPHLSPPLASALADARDQLDTAVRFCAVLLLATAIATPILIVHGWWLLVPVATAALAWLAYRAAVRAADDYGRLMRVAFDLHRFDLLRGLHLPLPDDPEHETQLNQQISRLLAGDLPITELAIDRYEHENGVRAVRAAEEESVARPAGL